jgi:hypothetical protein
VADLDPIARAEDAYLRILEGVAARSTQMGRRPIASHWPHVGSRHEPGGLLYAGQALDGWDAPVCPARWHPADVADDRGRRAVLAATQHWHADLPEPLDGVFEFPGRSGSSYWSLGADIGSTLAPGPDP